MRVPTPPFPEGIEAIPIDKTTDDLVAELESQIEAAEATPDDTAEVDALEQQLAAVQSLGEVTG